MASTEDDVVVRLRLKDVAKFIADVKSGKLAIDDLEKKISKAGRTAAKESEPTGGGFGKLGKVLGGLKWYAIGAIGSLAAAAGGVGAFAIKSTANLEQVTVAFTTLLHSSSAATDMVASLQTFAQKTPFELSGVEQTTQRLLAFGFSAKSVIPTLTAIGNAASGLNLGQQGMDEIALVLGQMKSLGRIQGGDLLQLAQHGVNGYGILEKGLGLTPAAFQKAMQAGKISAATGIPILLRGMEQQYKGLMAKESGTLGGIWSNMHDAIQQGLVRMVSPFLPAMKSWLQQLVDAMPQIEAFLTKTLNYGIGKVKIGVEMGRQVVDSIRTAISTGDWGPIGAALGTKLRDALIGGGSAAGGVDWYDIGKKSFAGVITFALGFISSLFDPGVWWGIVKAHWVDVGLIVLTVLTDGFGGLLGKFGAILAKIPLIGFIGRWIMGLQRGITTVRGPIMKFVSRIGEAIGNAFIRVWPDLGANLWYWFTRIGEFFTKDVPGLRTKVAKWVADLVPRAVEGMFTAIFKVIEKLMKPLRGIAKAIWKPIGDAFGAVVDWITARWSQLFGWLGTLPVIGGLFGGGSGEPGVGAPAPSGGAGMAGRSGVASRLATGGTVTQSGATWVGERGPELLNLGRGSQVIPLPRVPEFAGGGRGPVHVHVMLDKREIAQAVYDDMGDRVARR